MDSLALGPNVHGLGLSSLLHRRRKRLQASNHRTKTDWVVTGSGGLGFGPGGGGLESARKLETLNLHCCMRTSSKTKGGSKSAGNCWQVSGACSNPGSFKQFKKVGCRLRL